MNDFKEMIYPIYFLVCGTEYVKNRNTDFTSTFGMHKLIILNLTLQESLGVQAWNC